MGCKNVKKMIQHRFREKRMKLMAEAAIRESNNISESRESIDDLGKLRESNNIRESRKNIEPSISSFLPRS